MNWFYLILAVIISCFGGCNTVLTDIYATIKADEKKNKVKIPECLTGQEALDFLRNQIFTDDYHIPDPVSTKQANSILVKDILKKFKIEAEITTKGD